MATRALLFRGAWFATRAAATRTGFLARNFDFAFHAEHRFFETDLQLVEQVVAFARTVGATASAASEEAFETAATETAAEDLAENIVQIHAGETATGSRPAACMALRVGFVAELIVHLAFLFIAQNFISSSHFLEFLLRFLVARVAVRMIFHRLLAERLFDFVLRRRFRYFQYTVIIF